MDHERLLDDLHEQVRREANERIMALIALNSADVVTPAATEGPSLQP